MIRAVADVLADDHAFAGRRAELARLEHWIGDCRRGNARMVTMLGGPGVGKTALADEFVRRSRAGSVVYSASFHDDVGVPFLPVVSAIGRTDLLLDDRLDDAHVVDQNGQSVVGRNPQLFVAVTQTLLEIAARRPVVLRFDDVHWADRGSIDLLSHVLTAAARQNALQPLYLFVLLTARPDTGEGNALLGRLAQEQSHRTMELGPLDALEVNSLLAELIGEPPSGRIQSDVIEVTDGNPLFVRALIGQLLRRGSIRVRDGVAECTEEISEAGVELHQVLRSEVDRLDGTARRAATVASLMNPPVDLDALRTATGWDEAELDGALDEAEAGGVLQERPDGEIVFRHPAMRQLVARDLGPRATRSLHRDIATRLIAQEQTGDRDRIDRSIQIAHHLRRAGSRADPALVARYATVAARHSLRLGAWVKAARYAELALDRLASLGQLTPEAELELRNIAALGHLRNHDPQATEEQCVAAIRTAREVGDLEGWGRALVLEQRSKLSLRPVALEDALDGRELRDFLQTAGAQAPQASAQCWQLLAEIAVVTGGEDRHAATEAVRLAREIGDSRLLAWAHFADGLSDYVALRPESAIRTLRAGEDAARSSGDEWILASLLVRRSLAHLYAGELDAASTTAAEAEAQALATQNWSEYGLMVAGSAQIALATGDLVRAERLAQDALEIHARSSSPYTAIFAWPTLAYVRALRGDGLGAVDAMAEWQASGVPGSRRFRLLIDLMVPSADGSGVPLDVGRYSPAARRVPTVFDGGALVVDVEVGLHTGDEALLAAVRSRLVDLHESGIEFLLPTAGSTRRLIGTIDHAVGRVAQSHSQFASLGRDLARSGARTEELLTRVEGCLSSDAADLDQLAGDAGALARELEGHLLYAAIDRLRSGLPASVGAGIRLQRTVVVWDLVSSTPMLIDAGDDGFVDLVHELNDLIGRRLDEHRGLAFKYSGDGVFAWFLEPAAALRCAVAVRDDLHDRNRRSDVTALVVRTGIATGQPVADAGDLFGLAVVVAARLCDRAAPEQILATADTVDATDADLFGQDAGPMTLKGVPAPVGVVDVAPLTVV